MQKPTKPAQPAGGAATAAGGEAAPEPASGSAGTNKTSGGRASGDAASTRGTSTSGASTSGAGGEDNSDVASTSETSGGVSAGGRGAAAAMGCTTGVRAAVGRMSWAGTWSAARSNWLFTGLLMAGLVLRVLTTIAYRPALLYIDTLKYLFNAYPGTDPVGYKVPLDVMVFVGGLQAVPVIQHLLGLGLAALLYGVLVRRGCTRWLAALATAPLLLDAYQLQMEQTVMPDVWFEAAILAGLALLLWRPRPVLPLVAAAGLVLGSSATLRQVGEILLLPAVVYVLILVRGGRGKAVATVALAVAFALPVVIYSGISWLDTGHFRLSHSGSSSLYGRTAAAADCTTLKLPSYEQGLCPSPAQQASGPDNLEHSQSSPLKTYQAPPDMSRPKVITNLTHRILFQQPLRVARAYAADAAKLFALTRDGQPGDTPISRWQFRTRYPTFAGVIELGPGQEILRGGYAQSVPGAPPLLTPLPHGLASRAEVNRPLAGLLRGYQRRGGYTPGPLFLIAILAGLIASALGLRRQPAARRVTAAGAFGFLIAGLAVLGMSDLFEFSWRYQLPALVTLPAAGALGLSVILASVRRSGTAGAPDAATGPPTRLTAPTR